VSRVSLGNSGNKQYLVLITSRPSNQLQHDTTIQYLTAA